MASLKLQLLVFFAMTIMLLQIQAQDTSQALTISMNDVYDIHIEGGQRKTFSLQVTGLKETQSTQSLYVEIQSPFNDPYQEPSIIIRSEGGYQQVCEEEVNEYAGICEVQNQDLSEGRKFTIEVQCFQKCNLKLQAFLNQDLIIQFGHKITVRSIQQMGTLSVLKIQVPLDLQFSDISLIATISDIGTINQGVQMYVNIGNINDDPPTTQFYDRSGQEVWGQGIGVFLSQFQVKAGDWIQVYLILGQGVQIQFYSQSVLGNSYQILLNSYYQDYTTAFQTKQYILDLTQYLPQDGQDQDIFSETIQIVFIIYSGQPSIRVGFQPTLQNCIDNYDIEGTMSYLITPEMRAANNFQGIIYIEVESYWPSDYYLSTYAVSDEYFTLTDGVTQINTADNGLVHNYIYEFVSVVGTNSTDTIKDFRIKVEIMEGNAGLGLRRCYSLESQDATYDCLIKDPSQMDLDQNAQQFDQIEIDMRTDWNAYELYFEYDISQCLLYMSFDTLDIYDCQFQLVIYSTQANESLNYAMTIYSEQQMAALKQGIIFKDFIYKANYQYFTFDLPVIQNVQQVTFYLTIISGDAGLMGTTNSTWKYMLLGDALYEDDIEISLFNTLQFTKDKIKKNFFIAVYAYEASDVTLSVVVKRTGSDNNNTTNGTNTTIPDQNKTQQTAISLKQGLSQQYSLKNGNKYMNFTFLTNNQQEKVSVEVVEIQGVVLMAVYKKLTDQPIQCTNQNQPGELKCTFTAQKNTKYTIQVVGSQQDLQTFSVSYFYADMCKKYPFNLPQFVFLGALDTQCSTFLVNNQQKDLQIITSFSTLDLLTTDIKFSIKINGKDTIDFEGRSKTIPADQLKDFCKSQTQSNCMMEISYKGDSASNVQFYFVVEQIGTEMALFDGIVRKLVDQSMTKTKGKFFYYEVSSNSQSIRLFVTSKDNVGYYIGAKFIQSGDFIASPDDLYLKYEETDVNSLTQKENVFETSIAPTKGTSMIQIQPEEFSKHCTSCVMLISVYGLQQKSTTANILEIQVTQQQSFVYLGESSLGFLSQGQVYVYELSANPQAQSLLTVRDIGKQSQKQDDCFSVNLVNARTDTIRRVQGYGIVYPSYDTYRVIIESTSSDTCVYQISYSSLKYPVSVITPYMSVEINLQDSATSYYIYYHSSNASFSVLNYVKSGDVKLSINKIDTTNSIQTLVNKNIQMFAFRNAVAESSVFVNSSNTQHFCTDCYYMIAIQGYPNILSEMIISRQNQEVGLTTYGNLKQSLKKGESQSYSYYSIIQFNVSVVVVYGELNVTIINPEGEYVYQSSIDMSNQFAVPAPKSADDQYIDYYDFASKFKVRIDAVKDCFYYIGVKRMNVSMKIFEGVSMYLQLSSQEKTIEFVNLNQSQNVSVLLEVKDQIEENFEIFARAQVIMQGSNQVTQIRAPYVQRSENSFNFIFQSFKGSYFLTFSSTSTVLASVILVKKKLTHLMSSDMNLFTDKGVYQIYTPGHNLMIVIDSCEQEVQVKASNSYSGIMDLSNDGDKFGNNDDVLLEHANYGGHYVITAQNVYGQYFVEVTPKAKSQPLLYIISYFLYDKTDIMPYKKIDISPDINYELTPTKIIFMLEPVKQIASKSKVKILPVYTLFITNSSQESQLDSKCGLNYGLSLTQVTSSDNNQTIKFPVDVTIYHYIFQYSTIAKQVGSDTNVYYVSARVKVKFQQANKNADYPPFIDLAYTKTQITQTHHNVEFKSETSANLKFVILWIVMPFIIAAALFVLALKFCVKKYRQMYPDQLVQEDRQFGESEDQMKNSSTPADSLKDT